MRLPSRAILIRLTAAALMVAAAAYLALLGILYLRQEALIFPGTKLPDEFKFDFGPQRFKEIRIEVPGASLDALQFTQPNPRGLVFFIHGNAGNLSTWTTGLDFYRRINYDLFMFDYRGYGKSSGHIESEAQLHADVRAAWDAIAPRYRDKPIVVYGRSLGTGLATKLAVDVNRTSLAAEISTADRSADRRRQEPDPAHSRRRRHADSGVGQRATQIACALPGRVTVDKRCGTSWHPRVSRLSRWARRSPDRTDRSLI